MTIINRLSLTLVLISVFVSDIHSQKIVFADSAFKNALINNIEKIDLNNDKEIDKKEAKKITSLNVGYRKISSLNGLEHFTNLKILHCPNNNLKTLSLNNFMYLEHIVVSANNLEKLQIKNCPKLLSISCAVNRLERLDLSNLKKLEIVFCDQNKLKQILLTNCTSLRTLVCSKNLLENINLKGLKSLVGLWIEKNLVNELKIRDCNNLQFLYCGSNPKLKVLDLRNGRNLESGTYFVHFANCGNLKTILVDNEQEEINQVLNKIRAYNRSDIKLGVE